MQLQFMRRIHSLPCPSLDLAFFLWLQTTSPKLRQSLVHMITQPCDPTLVAYGASC